jgi:hypothetical protein
MYNTLAATSRLEKQGPVLALPEEVSLCLRDYLLLPKVKMKTPALRYIYIGIVGAAALSIMTFSIATLSIATHSIKGLLVTFSLTA